MLSHTLTQQSNNETLNTKHSNNHNGTEEGFHVFNFQSYERNYSIYYSQIFVHFDNFNSSMCDEVCHWYLSSEFRIRIPAVFASALRQLRILMDGRGYLRSRIKYINPRQLANGWDTSTLDSSQTGKIHQPSNSCRYYINPHIEFHHKKLQTLEQGSYLMMIQPHSTFICWFPYKHHLFIVSCWSLHSNEFFSQTSMCNTPHHCECEDHKPTS
jgi:hypothetical protein